MADLIMVYWRDIPRAQVIVRKGRHRAKRELPLRFTEAIDIVRHAGLAHATPTRNTTTRSESAREAGWGT
nr:virulence factor [Mesorhizobium tamadayense]